VGKRYTKEEISRIQALTEEGLTSNEIAIQLDRPEAGIRNIRYRMKMKLNQKESLKQLKRDRKLLSEKVNRLKRDIHNLNSRKKNIEKVLLTDEATLNTRLQTALRKLKDVRPDLFFPAWREIDNLIFELGSILDFFSREINLAFNLEIPLRSVGFSKVVRTCEKKIPDERITETVTEFHNLELHKYFRKMRNRITHRLPFVIKGMNDQIYFPDNPNDDNIFPKTDLMIDIYQTCRDWLHEILEFVDTSSVLVFEMIAKMVIKDEDENEITIDELIIRQRRDLEDRLG
jgi:hypothetical protein